MSAGKAFFLKVSLKERYTCKVARFKLRWCRARDLFESQIPVITGGFEPLGLHLKQKQP